MPKRKTLKKEKRDYIKILTTFSVVLNIILGSFALVNFISPEPPKRAELRILLDPNDDTSWESLSNMTMFNANVSLHNIGDAPATLIRLTVNLIYILPDGEECQMPATFRNLESDWNIVDKIIEKGETNIFSLTTELLPTLKVNKQNGEIIQIGDSISDKFQIFVIYDDGMGEDISVKTFNYF